VIIPARNAARTLPSTLEALERQTLAGDSYEVLVIDDGSTDRTAALVQACDLARVVQMPRRGGSFAARNLGLRHARGEIIAFTDADCLPAPDWLQHGLSDLDTHAADLLGGRIDVPLRPRPSVPELLDVCWHLDQAHTLQIGFVATANLFVRSAVFERVGTFDGRLISTGDREFCWRATAHGSRLAYSPRAVVVHPPRTRAGQGVRKAFRLGFGRAQREVFAPGTAPRAEAERQRSGLRRRWLRLPGTFWALIGRGEMFGIHRLRSQGYEPSRRQLLLIRLSAYLLFDLPEMTGYLVGRRSAGKRLRAGSELN
jgi:cellulose synthase/poly-beta-1,6-N-acetylglucosamine synthase-like glycosyltransferase